MYYVLTNIPILLEETINPSILSLRVDVRNKNSFLLSTLYSSRQATTGQQLTDHRWKYILSIN